MDIAAQVRLLEDAQGDPARLALAAVDFAFPTLSDADRDALKEALEAAAIPHWCNAEILASLLDLPPQECAGRMAQLDGLNEVEAFEARGKDAVNIHEAARLALRKRMAREEPERFRALSGRAAAYFAGSDTPVMTIERMYHRLVAAPDDAPAECEALKVEWTRSSHLQDRDAMAIALYELETTGLVQGRARLEVLLWYAENLSEHSEIARLAACVPHALTLARELGHASGQARAYDLLGEVQRLQGHLAEALQAHKSALDLRQRLADANPNDAIAKWMLAVAYSRLGDVYQDQSEFDDALDAFRKCCALLDELATADPTDRRWWRESVVAFIRTGDILRDRGQSDQALEVFLSTLDPIQQLVDDDPTNEDWQRDLAMSHLRIAQMYASDEAEKASKHLDAYIRICNQLLSHRSNDPRTFGDLAFGYTYLATVQVAQDDYAAAKASLGKGRDILQRLAERDRTMSEWRTSLAAVLARLGNVHWMQNELPDALAAYEAALQIMRELSEQDPANLPWRRELAVCLANVARVTRETPERRGDVVALFEEASAIYAALVAAMPENDAWAAERKSTDEELAQARQTIA